MEPSGTVNPRESWFIKGPEPTNFTTNRFFISSRWQYSRRIHSRTGSFPNRSGHSRTEPNRVNRPNRHSKPTGSPVKGLNRTEIHLDFNTKIVYKVKLVNSHSFYLVYYLVRSVRFGSPVTGSRFGSGRTWFSSELAGRVGNRGVTGN